MQRVRKRKRGGRRGKEVASLANLHSSLLIFAVMEGKKESVEGKKGKREG